MSVDILKFGQPFFDIFHVDNVDVFDVKGRAIVLNLDEAPIQIEGQNLQYLQSSVVVDTQIEKIKRAIILQKFDAYDDEAALFEKVKREWPKAYDMRKEERLKGVEHYLSLKESVRNIRFSLYHSASVPLNVGLHREHPFCEVPGFREVHTQIMGFGKMQQCREKDISTLYMEELMAPGNTHRPIYDEKGDYPWHQYETITPSIFMAVEILPEEMESV